MGWQPIETAPKDGSPVLLGLKGAAVPSLCHWGRYKVWDDEWHWFVGIKEEWHGIDADTPHRRRFICEFLGIFPNPDVWMEPPIPPPAPEENGCM